MSDAQDELRKLFSRVKSERGYIAKLNKGEVGDPFIFFPSLPGGQGDGTNLANHLAVPFWFMDVRGKFLKADPFPSIAEMAQSCAGLIREKFGEGPVILGGYCGGAIVAMDAAKHLADAGCDVRHLIILDAAPFNTEFESNDAFSRAGQRARQVVGKIFKDPSLETIGEIAQKTKTIMIRKIKNAFSHKTAYAQMSAEDIVPDFNEFHKADKKYMRSLWEAILAYRPPVLKKIPTTVYLVDDPGGRDLAAIWRGMNPNADIRIFPGNHATMHMEPSLAEAVQAMIAGGISPLPRVGKTASPGPLSKLVKRFT